MEQMRNQLNNASGTPTQSGEKQSSTNRIDSADIRDAAFSRRVMERETLHQFKDKIP